MIAKLAKGAKVAKGTQKATEPVLAYEAKLWQMADALRNNMDAAEYKHVVLGLIFLKCIARCVLGSVSTSLVGSFGSKGRLAAPSDFESEFACRGNAGRHCILQLAGRSQ